MVVDPSLIPTDTVLTGHGDDPLASLVSDLFFLYSRASLDVKRYALVMGQRAGPGIPLAGGSARGDQGFVPPGNAAGSDDEILGEPLLRDEVDDLVAAWRAQRPDLDVELNRQSADPADYAELLSRAGCEVDAWETTYVHIVQGEDPVLEWYKGTGLRPVLAALDAERAGDFLAEYGTELRRAYPPRPFGTIFPFRRVFAVAHRPG